MFWKRLLFSYLIVILLAFSILGILVFIQSSAALIDQVIYSNELILEKGSIFFSNYIIQMKSMALDIAVDEDVQRVLKEVQNQHLYITLKRTESIIIENTYLSRTLKQSNTPVELYPVVDGVLYVYNQDRRMFTALDEEGTPHLYEAYAKNGGFVMTAIYMGQDNIISLSCNIYDMEKWDKPIGVLEMQISAANISSLLYNIKLDKNISPYIIDDKGQVFLPYVDYKNLSPDITMSTNRKPIMENNEIILQEKIPTTKWKLVGILPEGKIAEKTNQLTRYFIYTGTLTVVILLLLSVYLAKWLSSPLKKLSRRLKEFEKGEFKTLTVKKTYSREVKTLYEQYNNMSSKIEILIGQVYEAAEKEKKAELLALQAQINPHFLYNTLDSISWMALKYKAEDVRFMVSSLANMMRYSLNSGKNTISVRDEIEQVRNYVMIQEIRFNNRFKTYFDISEDILDCIIIKLLLQPLVENAILHGFKNSGKYGDLQILGYLENNRIVIEVINEGDRLDLDKIHEILNPKSEHKLMHYGIRNVNDRLVRQYGKQFELQFFTRDGNTYARIEIPVSQLDEGDQERDEND